MYVLQGVLDELHKLDHLMDFEYLKFRFLVPALAHARDRALITPLE